MFKKPWYTFMILSFFFVAGGYMQYNQRYKTVGATLEAGPVIKLSSHFGWINDILSRLLVGILGYFTYKSFSSMKYLIVLSFFTFIGHFFFFLGATLDVHEEFVFLAIHIFISVAVGGYRVLTAEIALEEGGLDNFGMNWGMIYFTNFLGVFFYQILTVFINFKFNMGIAYFIFGILTVVFIFLAWNNHKKETA